MENKSEPFESSGLSEAEATLRLQQHGYNELPSSKSRSIFATAWDVVREPMFLLLLACGTIYLILGDVQEAVMLLGFVFVVLGITLYQERKTERALEALRDLSSPRALVIRGGERKRIAGRDVVPDDLVVLAEGDRVPADSVVLSCNNLSTDESLLTGESVPVRKVAWDGVREMTRPGGEDLPFVFSGTLIVQGQGIAQVRSTGIQTEMGNIGKALQTVQVEGTRLQKEVGRLVRRVAIFGLALCIDRDRSLRPHPWQLAPGVPGRDHSGDGDVAGRIPRRPDHLPRPGCVAFVEDERPGSSCAGDRNPRLGHGPLCGQDRHAHCQSHVDSQAGRGWGCT